MDGLNEREGRVEVCLEGQWGSICDNNWTTSDAAVICRQIGQYRSSTLLYRRQSDTLIYSLIHAGAVALTGAYFGQGTVSVLFDSLTCNGNETDLLQCGITGGSSCTHSADVGVQCPGIYKTCLCVIVVYIIH